MALIEIQLDDVTIDRIADRVASRLTAPRPAQTRSGLLDRRGIAAALGCSVSTLDRAAKEPGFPVHLVGARRRFELSEVRAWFARRGSSPTKPTSGDAEVAGILRAAGIAVRR